LPYTIVANVTGTYRWGVKSQAKLQQVVHDMQQAPHAQQGSVF